MLVEHSGECPVIDPDATIAVSAVESGDENISAGCRVLQGAVLIATGAAIFNGACLEKGSEVRIGGVVHVNSRLPRGAVVPINWIAVGNPAEILPPEAHERIWELQAAQDFPRTVFGLEREDPIGMMHRLTRRYGAALAAYDDDKVLD